MLFLCYNYYGDNMQDLIIENENLIYFTLKKIGLYSKIEEYYDIGAIGLCKAAKNYDSTKGYAFSTYAIMCIKNEILQEIRKNNSNNKKSNKNCISLNQKIDIGNDYEMQDFILSKIDIENDYILKEQKKQLYKAILRLDKKEQFIINHTYEINNCDKKTQTEISNILNLSQSRVSRLLNSAIRKLRIEMGAKNV